MKLIRKIEDKSAIIGIVGLGYVGLPMAVTVARKGFKVIGVDVSEYAVTHVNAGQNYIGDVDDDELKELVKSGMLKATYDYSEMKTADVIMIAVPTPLDKYQQPDSSYVRASVASLAENVSEDTLVILESTTYPGTTDGPLAAKLRKTTGLHSQRRPESTNHPLGPEPGQPAQKLRLARCNSDRSEAQHRAVEESVFDRKSLCNYRADFTTPLCFARNDDQGIPFRIFFCLWAL